MTQMWQDFVDSKKRRPGGRRRAREQQAGGDEPPAHTAEPQRAASPPHSRGSPQAPPSGRNIRQPAPTAAAVALDWRAALPRHRPTPPPPPPPPPAAPVPAVAALGAADSPLTTLGPPPTHPTTTPRSLFGRSLLDQASPPLGLPLGTHGSIPHRDSSPPPLCYSWAAPSAAPSWIAPAAAASPGTRRVAALVDGPAFSVDE
eukprot:3922131-Prymnesium_polylepis.2